MLIGSIVLRSMVAHGKNIHIPTIHLHLHIWDIDMTNFHVKWSKSISTCNCHGLFNIHRIEFYYYHIFDFPKIFEDSPPCIEVSCMLPHSLITPCYMAIEEIAFVLTKCQAHLLFANTKILNYIYIYIYIYIIPFLLFQKQ
jgi:hypothetical protein